MGAWGGRFDRDNFQLERIHVSLKIENDCRQSAKMLSDEILFNDESTVTQGGLTIERQRFAAAEWRISFER